MNKKDIINPRIKGVVSEARIFIRISNREKEFIDSNNYSASRIVRECLKDLGFKEK